MSPASWMEADRPREKCWTKEAQKGLREALCFYFTDRKLQISPDSSHKPDTLLESEHAEWYTDRDTCFICVAEMWRTQWSFPSWISPRVRFTMHQLLFPPSPLLYLNPLTHVCPTSNSPPSYFLYNNSYSYFFILFSLNRLPSSTVLYIRPALLPRCIPPSSFCHVFPPLSLSSLYRPSGFSSSFP